MNAQQQTLMAAATKRINALRVFGNGNPEKALCKDVIVNGLSFEKAYKRYGGKRDTKHASVVKSRKVYLRKLINDIQRETGITEDSVVGRRCMVCRRALTRAPLSQFYSGEPGSCLACLRCDVVVEIDRAVEATA